MNALRTAYQVEITAPLSVCDTFRCRFVCIFSAVFMFYYNSFVLFQFILRALLRHGSKVNYFLIIFKPAYRVTTTLNKVRETED